MTLLGLVAGAGASEARAATTVTGDRDVNAPLLIEPAGSHRETIFPIWAGKPVLRLETMPVTKSIDRVSLEVASYRGSCSLNYAQNVRTLIVDLDATANGSTSSQDMKNIGPEFVRHTWRFSSPVTIHAGKRYGINLYVSPVEEALCSNVKMRTYPHEGPINPGPKRCESARGAAFRVWHVQGQDDWSCEGDHPRRAPNFDPSMPTGWLGTRGAYNGYYNLQVVPGEYYESCDVRATTLFWRPTPNVPGRTDSVCAFDFFASGPGANVPDGWHYFVPTDAARPGARDVYLRLDTIDYGAQLRKYVPKLKYDSQGDFWAASPQTITDWPENEVKDGTSAALFSHQLGPEFEWGLPTLVPPPEPYPANPGHPRSPRTAGETDFIDAQGDHKVAADSFRNGPLDNWTYGRAVHDSEGRLWLQYWFFYYYNDQDVLGFGDHEGDWEGVQYRLKSDLSSPDEATYSQHTDSEAERCPWSLVRKEPVVEGGVSREAPLVYVAALSQASYFVPGAHSRPAPRPDDSANGLGGDRPAPSLSQIGETYPKWNQWPGRWGDKVPTPPSLLGSSRAPGRQAPWSDPKAFHDGAGPCSNPDGSVRTLSASRSAASAPAAPKVSGRRRGSRAIIRYDVGRIAGDDRSKPFAILLSTDSAGNGSAPRTERYELRRRKGFVRQKLAAGRGPFAVRASTFSRTGARSQMVSARLR